MAVSTRCMTPGAVYRTSVTPRGVTASVDLPQGLNLTEVEAEHLESVIHNALEMVLAPYTGP